MQSRFDYMTVAPGTYRAMGGLERYLADCAIEPMLIHLVKLRASQTQRLRLLPRHALEGPARRWARASSGSTRSTPGASARTTATRERAALAWTEAVTLIAEGHAPDAVYDEARAHFDDKALPTSRWRSPPSTPGTGSRLPRGCLPAPTLRAPRRRPDVDQLAADVPLAAERDPGSRRRSPGTVSAGTGFTRCTSKPASPVADRSWGWPHPVSAIRIVRPAPRLGAASARAVFVAVHLRHPQIEQHDLGPERLRQLRAPRRPSWTVRTS